MKYEHNLTGQWGFSAWSSSQLSLFCLTRAGHRQSQVISSVKFTSMGPYPGYINPIPVLFLFLSLPCYGIWMLIFYSLKLKGLYPPIPFYKSINLCSKQMRLKYKMPANFGYPIRDIIYLIFQPVWHSVSLGLDHAKWVIHFSSPDSKISRQAFIIWKSQLIIASWGNFPHTVES